MLQPKLIRLLAASLLAMLMVVPTRAAIAQTLPASQLSRWLSREVVPELGQLLTRHPRYRGQRVQIRAGTQNGLSEAIVTVLGNSLEVRDGMILVGRGGSGLPGVAVGNSIDELTCTSLPRADYLLQVSAARGETGADRVILSLREVAAGGEQTRLWSWQGQFSTPERQYLDRGMTSIWADGSLAAPWGEDDVDAAAQALSRQLACALRPQVRSRMILRWPEDTTLPAVFADTANATRHRLGNFRELGIGADSYAYALDVRVERFRDNIWQLWLTGTPRTGDLAPVQAVTYFETGAPGSHPQRGPLVASEVATPVIPEKLGPALKYFDVQMLDATQADRGRSRADLQVTLRIGNRSEWPIAYSFTLSGGHFENCIAAPGYYRHDRYGLLSGRLEGGATEIRRLVIENARHRPVPLFGVPRCAGFRDLQGFEDYASKGYKVTDYVRWDM